MVRKRNLKRKNLREESDSDEFSTSSEEDPAFSMPRGIKGKGKKPTKQSRKRKRAPARRSSNKKRRLDGSSQSSNGGTNSSNSQRISIRRSKRLEIVNGEERQKRATILSWLIDCQIVPESATIYYTGETNQDGFKKGTIERSGIFCNCCQCIFTIRDFQMHTGGDIKDNPYEMIGVDEIRGDGRIIPLSQRMKQALQKVDEPEYGLKRITPRGPDDDDDVCILCGNGGSLICCEPCLSTYHGECLDIQIGKDDPFFCTYCACKICRMPITENSITCSRCEKQCHKNCLEQVFVNVNKFPRTFCSNSCIEFHENLESQIGVKKDLQDGLSWTLLHRFDEEYGSFEVDERKRLEVNCKLAVALRTMKDCFEPIKDRHTRIDVIQYVVYNCGSSFRRIDFCGFLTAILEKGDEIIAVASIRVHGTKIAEMPFIATAELHRKKGMCRKLLNEIISVLQGLGVKTLLIPSSSETTKVWEQKYGFVYLEEETRKEIMNLNTLMFHDCSRMQLAIPAKFDLNGEPPSDEDDNNAEG